MSNVIKNVKANVSMPLISPLKIPQKMLYHVVNAINNNVLNAQFVSVIKVYSTKLMRQQLSQSNLINSLV